MAGHSKWAQIKHKKGITDAKRGKLFSKLVKEVTVAAQSGIPDPAHNVRLRSAIERARGLGLPKDNIDRAVVRAQGATETAQLHEFLYEITLPGGIQLIVEGITDNKNRALAEIKHLVLEYGGRMAEPGSLLWNFERVGTIIIPKQGGISDAPEEAELVFIDAGARDVLSSETSWIVEAEFSSLEETRRRIEQRGIVIQETRYSYRPKSLVTVPADSSASVASLREKLLEQDDVQSVFTNITPPLQ